MMDDGMLSQDEIDALLNVTEDNDEETEQTTNEDPYLTSLEKDTLGEIGNISLGSSATTLSTLLNQKVEITTPTVSIVKKTGFKEEFPYEHVSLQVDYMDGFDGENIFLMKAQDAAIISDIMLGGDGHSPKEELSEIELSAVQEAMNQMMGASATSMSTVFNKRVDISPPLVEYEDIDKLEEVHSKIEGDVFVKVSFQLKVGDLIDSNIMQLIPLDFAKVLVNQLLNPKEEIAATETPEKPSVAEQEQMEHKSQVNKMVEQPTVATNQSPQHIGTHMNENSTIQTASFSNFESVELSETKQRNLDMLLDIPLTVTVELGRTNQTVEDILELTQGSIVELDKLAGEPVDVLVNNKLIAKGEVVVIDENFGVRITDIVSQKDRLMKLN
ncbi:flagellar motor switch phosphatase FliY [Pseudogracilibacillus auburnensis]|uniref:flagellar motor switch phosphatase FliY n=1 Tax=Pseudogracilibacillus auburnensis TaxID=1494959 RepID=UPI001A978325|nr:flagellar motor switch phosphatase FliY [Pseudogracilibacillus auburnensis]MBO1003797.1 flagellar motor switch phosphatase FliY [Pseudogracilibacillus auburnensis]